MAQKLDDVVSQVRDCLAPACVRIEPAGSVRRGKENPKDLEFLIIPKVIVMSQPDLFGEVSREATYMPIGRVIEGLMSDGEWEMDPDTSRNGPRYKRLRHRTLLNSEGNLLPLELFITDPEGLRWGVLFAIRTGPRDFSRGLVTVALVNRMHVHQGRLHGHERGTAPGTKLRLPCPLGDECPDIIPTPEEKDFFEALGLPYMEPGERTVWLLKRHVQGRRS